MLGEVLVSKWAQHNGSSSFSCSLDIVVVAPRTAPAASRGSLFDGRDGLLSNVEACRNPMALVYRYFGRKLAQCLFVDDLIGCVSR